MPIEGLTQVNNAVKKLLHIDEKQFKQIVMIAQGEFRDLLNAKTDQRTEILHTIFLTNGYKNIEHKILLLDKQKKATRNVIPTYDAWDKKHNEVFLIIKQIEATEFNLEAAKAAVKQAKDAFDGAKGQEPEVEKLKQTINRIDDEEQKY